MKKLFNNPLFTKLLSAFLHLAIAQLALLIVLTIFNELPKLGAYSYNVFYYTLPFTLGLAISGQTFINRYTHASTFRRTLFIGLLAALFAFLWEMALPQLNPNTDISTKLPIVYIWFASAFIQLSFLDWRSVKPTEKKAFSAILLGIISLPMAAVMALLFLNILNSNTHVIKETYILPSNFEGEFRVVYGEIGGVIPPNENGRLVFKIPKNGILIVQPEFKAGKVDQEFFVGDKNGKTHAITNIQDYNKRLEEAPGALYWGPESGQSSWSAKRTSGEVTNQVIYTNFTLYHSDSKERNQEDYQRFMMQFDSLTNVLVVKVRKKNGAGIE